MAKYTHVFIPKSDTFTNPIKIILMRVENGYHLNQSQENTRIDYEHRTGTRLQHAWSMNGWPPIERVVDG